MQFQRSSSIQCMATFDEINQLIGECHELIRKIREQIALERALMRLRTRIPPKGDQL